MTELSIPHTPEDITSEWLTDSLRSYRHHHDIVGNVRSTPEILLPGMASPDRSPGCP